MVNAPMPTRVRLDSSKLPILARHASIPPMNLRWLCILSTLAALPIHAEPTTPDDHQATPGDWRGFKT